MSDTRYLDWPFLDDATARSRTHSTPGRPGTPRMRTAPTSTPSAAPSCARSAAAGWLRHAVGGSRFGGAGDALDTRALCLIRETLARHSGLADFAFAMQGLGSGAISLAGTPAQKQRYLTACRPRRSDRCLRAVRTRRGFRRRAPWPAPAASTATDVVIDGQKTWISNGGIADFYVVFVRTGEAPGARGISAFIVDADTPGLKLPSASR